MRFIIGVAMLAIGIGHAMPARAQQLTSGTITGVVLDDQGLRMPGVTVEIRNDQTNDVRTTVSNEVGLFTMPALPLGKYTLRPSNTAGPPFSSLSCVSTTSNRLAPRSNMSVDAAVTKTPSTTHRPTSSMRASPAL